MRPPAIGAGKTSWRTWARSRAPLADLDQLSARIVDGLAHWLPGAPDGHLLLYLAMTGELGVSTIADHTDRLCAVTRTPPEGPLTVHPLASAMEQHPFGYEQPVAGSAEVERDEIGVVLVPGLVFATDGGRLGHGKGYYDTLLSTLPDRAARVGITAETLLVERLPTEPHDVAMTHLATERGVRAVH